jgi:capsule polysaccharide modification protein KpsS
MPKDTSSVVKIDSALLSKVEEFIKKGENKLRFVNKKHFIDNAVNDFLKKMNENDKKN